MCIVNWYFFKAIANKSNTQLTKHARYKELAVNPLIHNVKKWPKINKLKNYFKNYTVFISKIFKMLGHFSILWMKRLMLKFHKSTFQSSS